MFNCQNKMLVVLLGSIGVACRISPSPTGPTFGRAESERPYLPTLAFYGPVPIILQAFYLIILGFPYSNLAGEEDNLELTKACTTFLQ
jgi:hypothetical protein